MTRNLGTPVDEILDKLVRIADQPYGEAKKWKEHHNKKVVGCFPMHFPEELIHAAGLLPVSSAAKRRACHAGAWLLLSFLLWPYPQSNRSGSKGVFELSRRNHLRGLLYSSCRSRRGFRGDSPQTEQHVFQTSRGQSTMDARRYRSRLNGTKARYREIHG